MCSRRRRTARALTWFQPLSTRRSRRLARARTVIGAVSRELITGDGTTLLVPSTTTHGVATWTAENASYTASDEVFGQVSVGAFKSSTQVIVSEELARDVAADFEGYLGDEPGQRIARDRDRGSRGGLRGLGHLRAT